MGFIDSLRDVVRTFSGEEYDYEDAPAAGAQRDVYASASTASTAPDYSSYYSAPVQPQEPVQRPLPSRMAIVSTIASCARKSWNRFVMRRSSGTESGVILSLKHTDPALARRWLDYLGGTAYTLGGKLNRIAPYTYLLTPKNVKLVAGFESEQ